MRMVVAAVAVGVIVFGGVYLFTLRSAGPPAARDDALPTAQGDVPPAAVGDAATAAAAPGYVQRDQGEGAVEIQVIYVTPEYLRSGGADAARYEPDRYSVFLVSLNTHSVDLSRYDMVQVSELRAGGQSWRPLRWVSTSDGSHHRAGVLVFPKVDPARPVELLIKTIAGIPVRTFRWTP